MARRRPHYTHRIEKRSHFIDSERRRLFDRVAHERVVAGICSPGYIICLYARMRSPAGYDFRGENAPGLDIRNLELEFAFEAILLRR